MAIEIEIEVNTKIRKDMNLVAKQSADGMVNLIFERGSLTLLGYSNSSFCMCKEFIDCSIAYNFRAEAGVLQSIVSCAFLQILIDAKTVTFVGKNKERNIVRRAQIKVNTDTTVNYVADSYNTLVSKLSAGYTCKSLDNLRKFDKISRVNNKSERGVIISKKQYYTWGDGFKYYAKTDMGLECFMLSDDLRSLIDFVGNDDNIIYEEGGYVVAKNTSDCYFGIRVAPVPENMRDLETLVKQKPNTEFSMPITELKSAIRPIRVGTVNDGRLTFQPSRNAVVVSTESMVYDVAIEYGNVWGDLGSTISLNFKLVNKLLNALDASATATIRVYTRFVSIACSDGTLLLIGRD